MGIPLNDGRGTPAMIKKLEPASEAIFSFMPSLSPAPCCSQDSEERFTGLPLIRRLFVNILPKLQAPFLINPGRPVENINRKRLG